MSRSCQLELVTTYPMFRLDALVLLRVNEREPFYHFMSTGATEKSLQLILYFSISYVKSMLTMGSSACTAWL